MGEGERRPTEVKLSGAVRHREAIATLSKKKRQIKQQLKDYDARFVKKHGRPPLKFEKEPIRGLYETYHAIKANLIAHQTITRHG